MPVALLLYCLEDLLEDSCCYRAVMRVKWVRIIIYRNFSKFRVRSSFIFGISCIFSALSYVVVIIRSAHFL